MLIFDIPDISIGVLKFKDGAKNEVFMKIYGNLYGGGLTIAVLTFITLIAMAMLSRYLLIRGKSCLFESLEVAYLKLTNIIVGQCIDGCNFSCIFTIQFSKFMCGNFRQSINNYNQ